MALLPDEFKNDEHYLLEVQAKNALSSVRQLEATVRSVTEKLDRVIVMEDDLKAIKKQLLDCRSQLYSAIRRG